MPIENTSRRIRITAWYIRNTEGWYIALKFLISALPVVVGNLLDIFTLGFFKKTIDVSPLMEKRFFGFSERTRENRSDSPDILFDKGLGGGLRFLFVGVFEYAIKLIAIVLAPFTSIIYWIVLSI